MYSILWEKKRFYCRFLFLCKINNISTNKKMWDSVYSLPLTYNFVPEPKISFPNPLPSFTQYETS